MSTRVLTLNEKALKCKTLGVAGVLYVDEGKCGYVRFVNRKEGRLKV